MQELSRPEIDELLRGEFIGRIGCRDEDGIYVVPVIYAYLGDAVYAYSVEGRKIRAMREHPEVCFEVDRYEGPGRWRSAIGFGRYEELDEEGAERARKLLRERFAGSGRPPRATGDGSPPVAFRIVLDRVTGRRRVPA